MSKSSAKGVLTHAESQPFGLDQQPWVDSECRNICSGCHAISEKCSRTKLSRKIQVFSLSHMDDQSNCTLCQFFSTMKQPLQDEIKIELDSAYQIRASSAKRELGAQAVNCKDSPAFVVIPPEHESKWQDYSDANGIILGISNSPNRFGGRQIQPQVDVSVIKEWLDFCDSSHEALCKQKASPNTPPGFRVIDCEEPKVVCWEKVAHPKQYITLSYVWGQSTEGVTKEDGTLPNHLPRTIEDAILLTKQLGYRYLWVDRYCMPHDDDVNKDVQIKSMGDIYQYSILTVIAAAGNNPQHGLPGISTTLRKHQPCIKVGEKTLVYAPFVRQEVLESTWHSRGWTYQEGLLSQRKLVFTDTQVYFQCKSMYCHESIREPLKELHEIYGSRMLDSANMPGVFPDHGLGKDPSDIEMRLNEYLKLTFTFEKDILDAFKGVLAGFEQKFESRMKSLCGLAIHDYDYMYNFSSIILPLSWYPPLAHAPKRRLGFPSWTWMGWELSNITFPKPSSFSYGLYHLFMISSPHTSEFRFPLSIISMEYADQSVLPWNDTQTCTDLIIAKDRSGISPLFIRLTGPALDVQIRPDGGIAGDDANGLLEQMEPLFYTEAFRKRAVNLVRAAYQMKEHENNSFLQFTLFIPYHSIESGIMLLLFQPEGCLHLERVGVSFTPSLVSKPEKLEYPWPWYGFPDALKGWGKREVRIG